MDDYFASMFMALVFGAAHAIEPGHGKTALFTYLAAGKCNWKDGVVIALSSSITHSIVVLVLAILSHFIFSHQADANVMLQDVLRYIGSGIIIGLGLYFLLKKEHGHDHGHSCGSCNHTQQMLDKKNRGSLLTSGALGLATGLIPCPSVVVAYLSGLASGNSLVGLKTVFFFALGMALSLITLVFVFNFGGQRLSGLLKGKVKVSSWNKIQGSVFLAIGLFTFFYH
jgi:ABC-type nickel/cobalt efflux system permease component RcnA